MDSPTLSEHDARRVLKHVTNYPLLVPDLGPEVLHLFVAGYVARFVDEVRRLASLDSHAAALLAYLHLEGGIQGKRDIAMAEDVCLGPARAGCPYAQYVMAWICKTRGQSVDAMAWMRKAAITGLFPPAAVDLGKFVIAGVGISAPDATAGLKILWDAHRLGHRMALSAIAESLRAGRQGLRGKLLGYVLLPVAAVRAARFATRHPLSEKIFIHVERRSMPLFKIATATPAPVSADGD